MIFALILKASKKQKQKTWVLNIKHDVFLKPDYFTGLYRTLICTKNETFYKKYG
jgi:hypothetical protein